MKEKIEKLTLSLLQGANEPLIHVHKIDAGENCKKYLE